MKVVNLIIIFLLFYTSFFAQIIDLKNPNEQYDYVIITKTNFVNQFDDFVEHKRNVKTLECAVVTVDQIYNEFGGWKYPYNSIREFISYAGKNWQEPQPKYFFIAGDITSIPNFRVEGYREIDTAYTDYYYSVDIDSQDEKQIDYYVGRISARNITELSNYLQKVIEYESTSTRDWNNRIMFVGVDDERTGELFKSRIENLQNNLFSYLNSTTFLSPSMYDETELRNNIINGINIEGYSSVFLWGKGNNTLYGVPTVLNMDYVNDIETDYYPFVSFLGDQKYSDSDSSGMLDRLLFNRNGAIGGFNSVAPNYVNLLLTFYEIYLKYLYSENGNSIAGAAVKAYNDEDNPYHEALRIDLFGVFGDPSLSLKYDILADINGKEELVNDFKLYQNYPNPFNPNTQISFSLPESAFVELKVYDNLGQEIANIVDEQMPSGKHTVNFNASSFSSGVYLYQIKAGIYKQTRKMLLLK